MLYAISSQTLYHDYVHSEICFVIYFKNVVRVDFFKERNEKKNKTNKQNQVRAK